MPQWPAATPPTRRITHALTVRVSDRTGVDTGPAALEIFPGATPWSPDDARLGFGRTSEPLAIGRVGQEYEDVLGIVGGVGERRVTLEEGRLPRGLEIDASSGRIHGSPTDAGDHSFRVRVDHQPGSFEYGGRRFEWAAGTIEASHSLKILGALAVQPSFPTGRAGELYSGGIQAGALLSDERVVWQLPDLGLSGSGTVLTGTPSRSGRFPISYSVMRGHTEITAGSATLEILPARPALDHAPLVFQAWAGRSFRYHIAVRGMEEPIAVTPKAIVPLWLRVQDGDLTGTPSEEALLAIPSIIVDARGRRVEQEITLRVGRVPAPLVLDAIEPIVIPLGKPYSWRAEARGGEGSYTWRYEGAMPDGLKFEDGALKGAAIRPGAWQATVSVGDTMGGSRVAQRVSFNVIATDPSSPQIVSPSPIILSAGQASEFGFAAEGGVGGYSWRFSGNLPPGLVWTQRGFGGTPDSPAKAGEWTVRALVTDERGQSSPARDFQIRVLPTWPALVLRAARDLETRKQGQGFFITLRAENALGRIRWSATGLPPGAVVDEGVVFGASDQAGEFIAIVTAEDQRNEKANLRITIRIEAN